MRSDLFTARAIKINLGEWLKTLFASGHDELLTLDGQEWRGIIWIPHGSKTTKTGLDQQK